MESETENPIRFDLLQRAAERILADYHQHSVVIEHSTLLTQPDNRNRIWRCQLRAAECVVPDLIVIKQVSPEGYDPSKPDAWDTVRFFRDWAGARFLSDFMPEDAHGPKFYGGNLELGFIILEDMGEHTSLVGPLLEGNAASAREALMAYASRLGRMHAASIGKESMYREIQRGISPLWAEAEGKSQAVVLQAIEKKMAAFMENCASLGVLPGETAKQELASALQRLEELGPFRTFIHSDPCPDNVFYRPPNLRLIDFEFACFGHALQDGLYGRLPFPTCWCANAVPTEVVEKMENAYRLELSVACPQATDDAIFFREAAMIAARSVAGSLQEDLEAALKQDDTWGIAGMRGRILSRIAMFLDTARCANQMPALRDIYAKLLTELQSRWPDATPLPVYPAFQALSTP